MVTFDLPVQTKKQRASATKFRKRLEELGFMRLQYSVYHRFCGNRERMEAEINKVKRNLPPEGSVSIFNFTDKQFGQVKHFYCRAEAKSPEKPQQLSMF